MQCILDSAKSYESHGSGTRQRYNKYGTIQSGISLNYEDRANWTRDTVQPMRRRAFVYQNIDQVLKNCSQWRAEADRALLFCFPFNRR